MQEKYCAFIIWGNGLRHATEITDAIRDNKNLEIKKILFHDTGKIGNFVRKIYSRDYAPFEHLEAKTKYLLKSNPRVIIILALNKNPRERFFGKGDFRHIECEINKKFKEELRNRYNPKNSDGTRTEEHVIHVTDSEYQVDHLLNLLGYSEGIEEFKKEPNFIIPAPSHLPNFTKFKIKKVDISSIYCNILKGDRNSHWLEKCELENSPHYQFLIGNTLPYERYLAEFEGYLLTDGYSITKFKNLAKNFSYLRSPQNLSYILVKEFQFNKYLVQDGVHRACVLKFRKQKNVIVAVIQ